MDKYKEYHKQYYQKNKEIIMERSKVWRENNPEKARDMARRASEKWRKKNPEKIKANNEKYYLSGMAIKVLKRDNYECQICGQKHFLHTHHFNSNKKDNSYWNLLTLCASCHKLTHKGYF